MKHPELAKLSTASATGQLVEPPKVHNIRENRTVWSPTRFLHALLNRTSTSAPFPLDNQMIAEGQTKQTLEKALKELGQQPTLPLDRYTGMVGLCAHERLNLPIANGSAHHARILIKELFEFATSEVCLLTGMLKQSSAEGIEIYAHEPVVSAARNFLQRPGTRLTIALEKGQVDGGDANPFLHMLHADPLRNGTVSLLFAKPTEIEGLPHCLVADRAAYRVEAPTDDDSACDAITAVANFGDKKVARELRSLFEDVVAYLHTDDHLADSETITPEKARKAA